LVIESDLFPKNLKINSFIIRRPIPFYRSGIKI
jgi:hypothetical protein